jgi:hypothetical protein
MGEFEPVVEHRSICLHRRLIWKTCVLPSRADRLKIAIRKRGQILIKGRRRPPASARNLHKNPQILNVPGICAANGCVILPAMGKIITVQFLKPRLPRRLLKDGWWLETPPAPASVAAIPKRDASRPKRRARHLTLITPGK